MALLMFNSISSLFYNFTMMQTSVVMNRVVVIKDQNLELLGRYSTDIIFMQKSSLIENET